MTTETPLIAYKGFDRNWQCLGYQYELGKSYVHPGEVALCPTKEQLAKGIGGFHACEYPLDVFAYYPPTGQLAVVEMTGVSPKKDSDSKRAAKSITIKAALTIPMLVSASFEWVMKQCVPANAKHAEGPQSASSATGDQSASSATGYQSASSATGYQSASSATGDQSASSATGDNAIAAAFGLASKAMAGKTGIVIVAWWDGKRKRLTTGYVGENGIEADTWYGVNAHGTLVPA